MPYGPQSKHSSSQAQSTERKKQYLTTSANEQRQKESNLPGYLKLQGITQRIIIIVIVLTRMSVKRGTQNMISLSSGEAPWYHSYE